MKIDNGILIDNKSIEEIILNKKVDFSKFTDNDIYNALEKSFLNEYDFAALLSPVAIKHIEKIAYKAKKETSRYFGNNVSMYTPLYISNYCVNHCTYCGFNCTNQINRGKLTFEEIEREYNIIASSGLREILILTGESRVHADLDYIGESVRIAKKYFSTIGIEIYPLDTEEYKFIHECGADFVSVYQETYNKELYKQVHLKGPKSNFEYRLNSQERALLGGMRGVSFGSLLGLGDYREDSFYAGLHAYHIQKKYPSSEISFSVPRIRPYINNSSSNPKDVHELQLLQVMLAFRLFIPFSGLSISTRENENFRNNVIGLCATKISAGVKTSVGGHDEEQKGDEQFQISDNRSVNEIREYIYKKGLQPVFTDYLYV